MSDQPQASEPPPDGRVSDQRSPASSDMKSDHVATTRRPRTKLRVKCSTCGRTFRWNSLARHRRGKHPEVPIPALERPNVEVRVRPFVLRVASRCFRCGEVLPAGTTQNIMDDRQPNSRRPRWAHLVCPRPSGASPPNPQNEGAPLALALLGSGVALSPFPLPASATPPAITATTGDALVPAEKILELGIVGTRASGKTIVLELAEANAEDVLRRLVGDDILKCQTCAAFGKTVAVPKSYLQTHDLTEHRDLWIRGRTLAEARLLEERERRERLAKARDTRGT
jgi:hypothetical protein